MPKTIEIQDNEAVLVLDSEGNCRRESGNPVDIDMRATVLPIFMLYVGIEHKLRTDEQWGKDLMDVGYDILKENNSELGNEDDGDNSEEDPYGLGSSTVQ